MLSHGQWFLVSCLILCILPVMAADQMEIFELKGRTTQEMIPLLRPFVGAEGTVTGMNNHLVVRATEDRMAEIRRIIGEFDRPPRRLLIQVRESAPSESSRQEIGISAGNRHISIGDPQNEGATLRRYTTRSREENLRTLQTLEGEPTLIMGGVQLPVVTGSGYVSGAGRERRKITYGYSDVDSGFYAIVNLLGDRVRIEITNRRERPLPHGAIQHQESRNVVNGKIGEWLPLAAIRSSQNNNVADIGMRADNQSKSVSDLWVKVELLE